MHYTPGYKYTTDNMYMGLLNTAGGVIAMWPEVIGLLTQNILWSK